MARCRRRKGYAVRVAREQLSRPNVLRPRRQPAEKTIKTAFVINAFQVSFSIARAFIKLGEYGFLFAERRYAGGLAQRTWRPPMQATLDSRCGPPRTLVYGPTTRVTAEVPRGSTLCAVACYCLLWRRVWHRARRLVLARTVPRSDRRMPVSTSGGPSVTEGSALGGSRRGRSG